jgi:aerobic carbon-monoxide dehydrogenase medium subunit
MKPAPFEYVAPTSLAEAVRTLAADEGGKILAGGQSLMPLLSLRLARPTLLVDINRLGLDSITVDSVRSAHSANSAHSAGSADSTGPVVRVGALVRHRRLELDPVVSESAPLLASAAPLIGYPAIRNLGTIGGSLAHADPVAELPAVLVALSGSVLVTGVAGEREIAALDLFEGFLTTSLAPDEIIVEVRLPPLSGVGQSQHGASFCEWAPRTGDFAEAGVGVAIGVDDAGICTAVGAAACGVGSTPVFLTDVLGRAGVAGAGEATDGLLRAVAREVAHACAGAEGDRAELAGLLAARAVSRAFTQTRLGQAGSAGAPGGATAA